MANIRGPIQYKVPPLKPRLTHSFEQGILGGMNTSRNADEIAPNESPSILNMEIRQGLWSKRYGYARVNPESWGNTPIQGMHEYWLEGESEPVFLVFWGGKLWSIDDEGERTDLMPEPGPEEPENEEPEEESAHDTPRTDLMQEPGPEEPENEEPEEEPAHDTPVSFFTMNGRCYILTGDRYLVYDGENPATDVVGYVPTIVKGKSPDGAGGYAGEELNMLSDSWREEFTGDGAVAAFVLNMAADEVECYINGELVNKAGYTFPSDTDDYTKITFATAPDADAVVSIQGTKTGLGAPDEITSCTIAQEWGGRNDTRVFFSGNPAISNRRWHSGLLDPTYFPVSGWDDIGSDAEAVTGFGRMVDYQVIYKERTMYYSSVEGPDSEGRVSFPSLPMNMEYGCIAPRTVQPAQGGLLALSRKGVTFTVPSFVRGQLNVVLVSKKVNGQTYVFDDNKEILKGILDYSTDELKAAHAVIFKNKYYLHIKDKVWVLDLEYSNLMEGITCWYTFEGIPGVASCFLERTNVLWLGANFGGLIYKSRKNTDLESVKYKEDHIGYDIPDTFFDAYWTSPMIYASGRDWVKKFKKLLMIFNPSEIPSDVFLTFISDQGNETIKLEVENTYFNYAHAYYDRWSYGVETAVPFSQSEKVGYRGEYIQWRLRSGWDNPAINFSYCNFDYGNFCYDNPYMEGLQIVSQVLTYDNRKQVK